MLRLAIVRDDGEVVLDVDVAAEVEALLRAAPGRRVLRAAGFGPAAADEFAAVWANVEAALKRRTATLT